MSSKFGEKLAADLSQNLDRCGARTDGVLPTITPKGIFPVPGAGRLLVPVEKLLVHGYPIHTMSFPPTVTEQDIETMGGQTMSIQVVAAATLLALSFVDWVNPASNLPSCKPVSQEQGQGEYLPMLPPGLAQRYGLPWKYLLNPNRSKPVKLKRGQVRHCKPRTVRRTVVKKPLLVRLAQRWNSC